MGIYSKISNGIRLVGFDPSKFGPHVTNLPPFIRDSFVYRQASIDGHFPLTLHDLKPILLDYNSEAGEASGHYFFQDLWAARKIFEARPARHLDIGSRLDGFVAHVLSFMAVEVIDIRPLNSRVPGLTFKQADARMLMGIADNAVESLSSLHAVEHFGLGRYGDRVDPAACFSAMRSMARVLPSA